MIVFKGIGKFAGISSTFTTLKGEHGVNFVVAVKNTLSSGITRFDNIEFVCIGEPLVRFVNKLHSGELVELEGVVVNMNKKNVLLVNSVNIKKGV